MNYVQLQQIIQDYSENTEQLFIANIPKFVEQAETRIYNMVQIPSLRKNVTGTMTAGNQYLSLPNDWLSNYSIAIIDPVSGAYTYLLNKLFPVFIGSHFFTKSPPCFLTRSLYLLKSCTFGCSTELCLLHEDINSQCE